MVEERYYETLSAIHKIIQPRNYLEIGVRRGDSWRLIDRNIPSIGIDPAPDLQHEPMGSAKLFVGTSDAFFTQHSPAQVLGHAIDLAFVDGMHLFEYALRDFANIEKHASPTSTVLLHDCFPIDAETSGREPLPNIWTGDIWKVIVCLKEVRPDLSIDVLDVSPSGLGVISNLNPNAHEFRNGLEANIKRFVDLPFSYLGDRETTRRLLNVRETTDANVARICRRERQFEHMVNAEVARISRMMQAD